MTFKPALQLLEALKMKRMVRNNKVIKKKVTDREGYKVLGGKEVRMSAAEKRKRAKSAKKAARKKVSKMASITRKQKKSMKKVR